MFDGCVETKSEGIGVGIELGLNRIGVYSPLLSGTPKLVPLELVVRIVEVLAGSSRGTGSMIAPIS